MRVHNMDDLAVLDTAELDQMQSRIKDQIRYIRRNGGDTGFAEVELSYIQRELQIREQREIFAQNLRRNGYYNEVGV